MHLKSDAISDYTDIGSWLCVYTAMYTTLCTDAGDSVVFTCIFRVAVSAYPSEQSDQFASDAPLLGPDYTQSTVVRDCCCSVVLRWRVHIFLHFVLKILNFKLNFFTTNNMTVVFSIMRIIL